MKPSIMIIIIMTSQYHIGRGKDTVWALWEKKTQISNTEIPIIIIDSKHYISNS